MATLSSVYLCIFADESLVITVNLSIWGAVEPACSLIAACLPIFGPLLLKGYWRSFLPFYKPSASEIRSRGYDGERSVSHREFELHSLTPAPEIPRPVRTKDKHSWHRLRGGSNDNAPGPEAAYEQRKIFITHTVDVDNTPLDRFDFTSRYAGARQG